MDQDDTGPSRPRGRVHAAFGRSPAGPRRSRPRPATPWAAWTRAASLTSSVAGDAPIAVPRPAEQGPCGPFSSRNSPASRRNPDSTAGIGLAGHADQQPDRRDGQRRHEREQRDVREPDARRSNDIVGRGRIEPGLAPSGDEPNGRVRDQARGTGTEETTHQRTPSSTAFSAGGGAPRPSASRLSARTRRTPDTARRRTSWSVSSRAIDASRRANGSTCGPSRAEPPPASARPATQAPASRWPVRRSSSISPSASTPAGLVDPGARRARGQRAAQEPADRVRTHPVMAVALQLRERVGSPPPRAVTAASRSIRRRWLARGRPRARGRGAGRPPTAPSRPRRPPRRRSR